MSESRAQLVAPLTATALIALQVGSNAIRDGLFLSFFAVQTLPYFMAGAALLSVPAAQLSGHFLRRFGPARVVPVVLASSALLFLAEWGLFGWLPRAVSVLLYLHSSNRMIAEKIPLRFGRGIQELDRAVDRCEH